MASTSMTLNLEHQRILVFFLLFSAAAHIFKVNCTEMAKYKPEKPAQEYKTFNIKRPFLTI